MLGLVILLGVRTLFAAGDSLTIRVPTPVVIGTPCRVAMSMPMAGSSPVALFQGKRYPMRTLSAGVYAASWSTKGMSPGTFVGEVVVVVQGQSMSFPFDVQLMAVPKAHSQIEGRSESVVLDKKTEAVLKMEALEMNLDRVSLEKEMLQPESWQKKWSVTPHFILIDTCAYFQRAIIEPEKLLQDLTHLDDAQIKTFVTN